MGEGHAPVSPPPLRPCCTVHTEDLKRITLLYKRVKVIESISLKLFKGVLHCIPEEFNLLYSIIQKRFNRHFVLLACLRTARGSPPYIHSCKGKSFLKYNSAINCENTKENKRSVNISRFLYLKNRG